MRLKGITWFADGMYKGGFQFNFSGGTSVTYSPTGGISLVNWRTFCESLLKGEDCELSFNDKDSDTSCSIFVEDYIVHFYIVTDVPRGRGESCINVPLSKCKEAFAAGVTMFP